MDLVNFKSGHKTVSLPILSILLTERYDNRLTELPNDNPSFVGIRDFMGSPVPVFDLSTLINKQSTEALHQQQITALDQAQQQFSQWLKQALEGSVSALHSQPFYKWLNKLDATLPELATLFSVTKKHLLSLQNESNKADTKKLTDIRDAFERACVSAYDMLEQGFKPIVVYVTQDGRQPKLGLLVDSVEDTVSIEQEKIKPLEDATQIGFEVDSRLKKLLSGLVELKDKHSIVLNIAALEGTPS